MNDEDKNDNQITKETKITIENIDTKNKSTASIEEVINNVLNALNNKMKKDTKGFFQFLKEVCYKKEIEEWCNKKGKKPTDDEIICNIIKDKITNRIINTLSKFKEQYPNKFNKIYFRVNDWSISLNLEDQDNNVVHLLSLNDFFGFCHEYPIAEQLFKEIDNQIYGITIKSRRDINDNNTNVISASYGNSILQTPSIEFRFKYTDTFKINEFTAKKEHDKSILKVHLNENKITKITKYSFSTYGDEYKSPKQPDEETLKQELKKILLGDETNKVFIERIEDEFDNQQKQVFNTIKKHIGIEEIKKDEENKKEADNKNDNTIADNITNQQSNTGLKEANTRKWFGRYTDTDGRKYFSCCCFDIPLQ